MSKSQHPDTSSIEALQNTKQMVIRGKNNNVTAFRIPSLEKTALGKLILYRLLNDRDIKILITSKGTTTGTGKTTLAIWLSRWINGVANTIFDRNYKWSAENETFVDVWEYLQAYNETLPGVPLITDELEYMADRRRSNSHENVYFSQAWGVLRYRNVVTIGTAPGLSTLDKRIPENADLWINVQYTGKANTYYLTVDDFTEQPVRKRLKINGYRESIYWPDCDDDDPDYRFLQGRKEDIGIPGLTSDDSYDEQDVKEEKRNLKTQMVVGLLKEKEKGRLSLTQKEIGDIEGINWSQQNVAKIKGEFRDEIEAVT
jgi:hypothetical protein